jgi:hypothetical protein
VIARGIKAFYDAMEQAGQERGERSGEFFWVDGVAMDDTGRQVPLNVAIAALGENGNAVADRVLALWEPIQLSIR